MDYQLLIVASLRMKWGKLAERLALPLQLKVRVDEPGTWFVYGQLSQVANSLTHTCLMIHGTIILCGLYACIQIHTSGIIHNSRT
jgi:hypothetical protein